MDGGTNQYRRLSTPTLEVVRVGSLSRLKVTLSGRGSLVQNFLNVFGRSVAVLFNMNPVKRSSIIHEKFVKHF